MSFNYSVKFLTTAIKILAKYNDYLHILNALVKNLMVFKTLKKVHAAECMYIIDEFAELQAEWTKAEFRKENGKTALPEVTRDTFFSSSDEILVFHEIISRNKETTKITEEILASAMNQLEKLDKNTKSAMCIMVKFLTAHKLKMITDSNGK